MNVASCLRNAPAAMAGAALLLVLGLGACSPPQEKSRAPQQPAPPASEVAPPATPLTVPPGEWLSLFDGETLIGWRMATEEDFETHGEVGVKDGCIILGQGYPYTGIRWEGDFPRENFEVAVDARRLTDCDIFCGLTVPVGKAHITLVLGGWGDSVVGLSCVDDFNASENETTVVMSFKNNQWYNVRLRVTSASILAWIDGKQVIEQKREGHTFTIYDQLNVIRSVGFFSWETTAALRDIEMTRLPENP